MLIALFPGDGIGPEIVAQAKRVLDALAIDGLTYEEGLVGGSAYKAVGHPLPPETLDWASSRTCARPRSSPNWRMRAR